ncbi:hypothetical protein K493DRAFT_307255 [Basidiobolus meristosporus CBS 931.73]|uniref:Uncharacterized protein n=1 Tax=Basidiobolus meristosporus CBS 931.73 TaxID=1314790 RepID=A0A1Y1XIC5_9FUNG|nr:hypothetical protein K493DRAFT_307255 [Basidiobolus meristosporus CBS 931.73]|eukprot:ORX85509.1 hypothetical protein K493DRAFT_307255 [Basidiobolus meristosporus CBS 931.73]
MGARAVHVGISRYTFQGVKYITISWDLSNYTQCITGLERYIGFGCRLIIPSFAWFDFDTVCTLIPNSETYTSCDTAVRVFGQEKSAMSNLISTYNPGNGYSSSTSVTRNGIAALIRKECKQQNLNAQRYVCRSVDPTAIVTAECKRQTTNAGRKHCVLRA